MGAITNAVKVVLNDEERKNMVKIFKEALHYMMIEKELPYCYFSSLLYKKGAPDYRNFIGLKKAYNIINNYMYKNGRNMELEDKRNFGKTVLAAGLNTPQILASSIVDGGVFLVQNEQKNIIENITGPIELVNGAILISKVVAPVLGIISIGPKQSIIITSKASPNFLPALPKTA